MDKPSDMQRHFLSSSALSYKSTRDELVEEFKEANLKIREIGNLKGQNRITEQQRLVGELKESYQSYRNISFVSGISLKTVHKWCSLPKK